MSRKVRIGIVGAGLIGKAHLRNYANIADAEIVAICDVNVQEAQRVAEQFGIPNVYSDFKEMLQRDDIEAVDVCLHNNLHSPVTIAAFKAGKDVYCEKPIAGSYSDGVQMLDAAKAYGKKLHIQLGTLYRKETKAAKALIDGGMLGKLYHARATGHRRRGRPFIDGYGTPAFLNKDIAAGGALIDMGVYHIAQMLYLLDTPKVERISGKGYREMDMDATRAGQAVFDVEELGLGFVKFEGGATLDIYEAWSIHLGSIEGCSIVGNKGGVKLPAYSDQAVLAPFSFHTTLCDIDINGMVNLDEMDGRWNHLKPDYDAYQSSQHHWVAALQGRVELLPTAHIALQTMLVSEGIYLSDRLGREVSGDEIIEHSLTTAITL
ncbi:Gfo/Idh/MocA family protein [Paenibacillus radicis (ex Gao et al. 2016)]|uniref:Oxidoreductase n=1 Tax=Paenibacillus radicis (ex Gao et al. 2016) TaxID=1737354 RepID=A0A917LXA9_9BACL|nr:Gfo/Idh/MocA family oxidoreductase [Paenibacillus radicis (ex Gao et al. 2016)]GGG65104.1 oxidoreductase [Paenibacillus radicis (ex Gao et al. 2016)]